MTDHTNMIADIDLRFQSGNAIPVTSARITADEWIALSGALATRAPVEGELPPLHELTKETMRIGGRYNWKNQRERLVYMGYNRVIGYGFWHQFALVEKPGVIWNEVRDSALDYFEETPPDLADRAAGGDERGCECCVTCGQPWLAAPAGEAQAVQCGKGCACLAQCGDVYAHAAETAADLKLLIGKQINTLTELATQLRTEALTVFGSNDMISRGELDVIEWYTSRLMALNAAPPAPPQAAQHCKPLEPEFARALSRNMWELIVDAPLQAAGGEADRTALALEVKKWARVFAEALKNVSDAQHVENMRAGMDAAIDALVAAQPAGEVPEAAPPVVSQQLTTERADALVAEAMRLARVIGNAVADWCDAMTPAKNTEITAAFAALQTLLAAHLRAAPVPMSDAQIHSLVIKEWRQQWEARGVDTTSWLPMPSFVAEILPYARAIEAHHGIKGAL
jgi:hypothetical protein